MPAADHPLGGGVNVIDGGKHYRFVGASPGTGTTFNVFSYRYFYAGHPHERGINEVHV